MLFLLYISRKRSLSTFAKKNIGPSLMEIFKKRKVVDSCPTNNYYEDTLSLWCPAFLNMKKEFVKIRDPNKMTIFLAWKCLKESFKVYQENNFCTQGGGDNYLEAELKALEYLRVVVLKKIEEYMHV
jgi:hypothetical protein